MKVIGAISDVDNKQPLIEAGARLNANLIGADGSVGNSEYGYLDGVTSAIQTQLDAKMASSTTVITTDQANAITANTEKVTASTANVTTAGALMDTELTNLAAVKAINQSLVTTASPTFAYVLAKIPMIQLNTTNTTSNAYLDYDGVGGGYQIQWNNQEIYDSDYFTHSTDSNSERIVCLQAGRYEINYVVVVNGASGADQRAMPTIRTFVNGSWHADTRYQCNTGYLRRTASCNNVAVSGSYIIACDADDYISLATGYAASFGADTDDALELKTYNVNIGHTKLSIKKIG